MAKMTRRLFDKYQDGVPRNPKINLTSLGDLYALVC